MAMPVRYPKDLARHVHSHLASAKSACPSLASMENLFETMYIASLKREEAETVTCRLAFVDQANPDPEPPKRIPEDRWKHFALEQDIPLTVRNLVKLSKAVDPWSSTIAVDLDSKGDLRIWGLIDQSVHHNTFVMQETDRGPQMPGAFQAVIEGVGEIAVYRRVTFIGRLRQDMLITREMGVLQGGPIHDKFLPAIEQFQQSIKMDVGKNRYEERSHWDASFEDEWFSVLSRILIGIQHYGHGGAILISDSNEGLSPRFSLKYPRLPQALYRAGLLKVKRTALSDKIHEEYIDTATHATTMPVGLHMAEAVARRALEETEDEITGCIRFLSSLSRVDGLIWLKHDLSLQGFGVVITTEEDPDQAYRAKSVAGTNGTAIDINNFGTRHRSMIRQCSKDPESVGFVISQDGDVRAITSVDHKTVMWENIRHQRFTNARPARANS